LPEATAVVVCDPADPYYPLAKEISESESLPCISGIREGLRQKTRFLIWVGSPGFFSDSALAQFEIESQREQSQTSVGVLTGNSLEDARALWKVGKQAGGSRVAAVNQKKSEVWGLGGEVSTPTLAAVAERRNLEKSELDQVLAHSDYVTIVGQGGGSYLQLPNENRYTAKDLPALPPMMLATSGWGAIRLNEGDSLALAAIRRGVAGCAGFAFKPIDGFLMGEFDGLPLRYTWPGVTVGEVIRIQNRGTVQAMAAFPFYLLLGDPRMALQPEGTWTPLNIETLRGVRTLSFGETPPGMFPLRIRNGAQYHYFELPEIASASDYDFFYNSRLQMIDSGMDKLLLVMHPGGELQISMRPEPPRFWRLTDAALDSLDYVLIFLWGSSSPWISISLCSLALLGLIVLKKGREEGKSIKWSIILSGLALGLFHMVYVLLRIGQMTVTSKMLSIVPSDIIATTLLGSCGTLLFLGSVSWWKKAAGILVAIAPGAGASAMLAVSTFVANSFQSGSLAGSGLYNYSRVTITLIGTGLELVIFSILLAIILRMRKT
jgi:hypothetical protein